MWNIAKRTLRLKDLALTDLQIVNPHTAIYYGNFCIIRITAQIIQ